MAHAPHLRSLTDTVGEFDSAVAQHVGVRPSGRFSDPQGLPGSGLKAALRHAGDGWGAGPGIRQQYPHGRGSVSLRQLIAPVSVLTACSSQLRDGGASRFAFFSL
jgi:hypothetical protein